MSPDEEMANADRELQQMGYETLDRIHQSGADPEDVRFVGWMAGLINWTPEQRKVA